MNGDDRDRREPVDRRGFLGAVGSAGAIGLAGRLGPHAESAPPEERIAYDPYEAVDWGSVERHKSEFHSHVRGGADEPADVVDVYRDRGYTAYAVANKGDGPMAWPWTEFSEIDGRYEDRDPASMDVVSFPGCELTLHKHVDALFSTLDRERADEDAIADTRDQIQAITEREDHAVPENGGLAVLSHPHYYYREREESWTQFREHFAAVSRESGFVGLEAFNWTAPENEDVRLWDALLAELAPDRMIWGFGVDDPKEYVVGRDVDVRWTTLLLDEEEFDPSDQEAARRAAAAAVREGRTLCHEREPWDDDREEPPPVPRVEAVEVDPDAGTISVEASDYDDLAWVGDGEIVSTDETVALAADGAGYLRAHLLNDAGGQTSTQPIGLGSE